MGGAIGITLGVGTTLGSGGGNGAFDTSFGPPIPAGEFRVILGDEDVPGVFASNTPAATTRESIALIVGISMYIELAGLNVGDCCLRGVEPPETEPDSDPDSDSGSAGLVGKGSMPTIDSNRANMLLRSLLSFLA